MLSVLADQLELEIRSLAGRPPRQESLACLKNIQIGQV
jgi:hypothetical protein